MKHELIWSGCVGKATYDSKGAAMRCLRFRKIKRRANEKRGNAEPYRCENCNGWHIGAVASRAPGKRK